MKENKPRIEDDFKNLFNVLRQMYFIDQIASFFFHVNLMTIYYCNFSKINQTLLFK